MVRLEREFLGRKLFLETGRLAKQATSSVLVGYGDSVVLVTVVISDEPEEEADFLPLTVDFEDRFYAAGKIPGGFIKREGRPSERAILNARIVDRPIRPLFPEGFFHSVQIIITTLSTDQENPPELLGLWGASSALCLTGAPFNGPIGAVKVGLIDGKFVFNPFLSQLEKSDLDLLVVGTRDNIVMIETQANEIPEDKYVEALYCAMDYIRENISLQEEFINMAKQEITTSNSYTIIQPDPELVDFIRRTTYDRINEILRIKVKKEREARMSKEPSELIEKALLEMGEEGITLKEKLESNPVMVKMIFKAMERDILERIVLDERSRADGRSFNQLRPISCEVGLLPRTHGSAIFTRGETQVLTVVTLGSKGEEQIIDDLGIEESKRYMHHYNFPPYSVGEIRPLRGPGRREIGHGALAEKALIPVIPSEEDFPYTIRVVSDVLESNGSTSMASTCGSTLALMDAGVPIKAPVAGIAIGLVSRNDDEWVTLTDIQGLEDAYGEMDFKVAGTKKGITAVQLDTKRINGIPIYMLEKALQQAREAREIIIDKILETIPAPRITLSPYAPRIFTLTVSPDKIGDIIGPGGKVIKKIIEETDVKIDIEQDGRIYIYSSDESSGKIAKSKIEEIAREVEAGQIYEGKVTRVTDYGIFVEILPGKEGLLHISQMERLKGPINKVFKPGDSVLVKVYEIDNLGRISLTRKGLVPAEKEEARRVIDQRRK
ncbi:MAG: polyribonucleotide nucleotidyltransferase [bacterium]